MPGREVVIAGVGLHPFGRFPEETIHDLARTAIFEAFDDAGVTYKDIQAAFFGHVYFEGMSVAAFALHELGLTGIPIINVENACASGTMGMWLGYWGVASGMYDIVLAFGAEKVPRGPVSITSQDSLERLVGADFMMAGVYATRMRRYMEEFGAPAEAFAKVSVREHNNAVHNPYAQYKKVFTLEEVMNSRMIADPLTLYQCCPTSEGGSAAVICAKEVADKYVKDTSRLVNIAGMGFRTLLHGVEAGGERSLSMGGEEESEEIYPAAKDAYEMAGLEPEDVNVAQAHDAATPGAFSQLEGLGLANRGEAWKMEMDGRLEIDGDLPLNTDGGLQAMGHPFGATGIRMVHELVTQLRGEAGTRQIKKHKIGIAGNGGAGGISTVTILKK